MQIKTEDLQLDPINLDQKIKSCRVTPATKQALTAKSSDVKFKFPDDGDSDKSEDAQTPLKRPKPTINKVYDEDIEKQDVQSKKSSTKKSEGEKHISDKNDVPDQNVKASLASSQIDSNEPLWVS